MYLYCAVLSKSIPNIRKYGIRVNNRGNYDSISRAVKLYYRKTDAIKQFRGCNKVVLLVIDQRHLSPAYIFQNSSGDEKDFVIADSIVYNDNIDPSVINIVDFESKRMCNIANVKRLSNKYYYRGIGE